jgi:hypothetical protein
MRGPKLSKWIFALSCWLVFDTAVMAQTPAASPSPPGEVAKGTSSENEAGKDDNLFYIRSSGLIADSSFIALSLNSGGSAMSERLAFLILQAADRPYRITVAGASEVKTMRVIKDAFDSAGPMQLPYLDFTFIGSPKAAARVEKLVAAVHGTFHTRIALDNP